MKIYNEVTTIFNDSTGKWETLSEDSFDYNGPLDLAQGAPPNSAAINTSDTISDTIKTTTGYFTGGDGTLAGDNIFTGSQTSASDEYYINVLQLIDTDTAGNVIFCDLLIKSFNTLSFGAYKYLTFILSTTPLLLLYLLITTSLNADINCVMISFTSK